MLSKASSALQDVTKWQIKKAGAFATAFAIS